ncbi:MAG: C-GCAxxG-C-C family protein [Chloroflexi bacterium]|nr:C-GCAxxG-C-C family protein [Chloroflexota bacterium]
MTRAEAACAAMHDDFSCAQAVFATFAREMGVDQELALRAAGTLGGGVARMGETCGAVSGALMVVGLRHGMTRPRDTSQKDRAYAAGAEFVAEFIRRFGSMRCKELLGVDLSQPGGLRQAKRAGLFETRCPLFVEGSAQILEALGYPGVAPPASAR